MDFYSFAFDASCQPKNGETLEEHKKHCKAAPGNCPFEKALAKKEDAAVREDDLAKGRADGGSGVNPSVAHDVVLAAAKTVNHHLANGDTNFNPHKIVAFQHLDPSYYDKAFKQAQKVGTEQEKEYLGQMLGVCGAIQTAVGNAASGEAAVKAALKDGKVPTVPAKPSFIEKYGLAQTPALSPYEQLEAMAAPGVPTHATDLPDDAAKNLLKSVAKSINHHIDTGDHEPNAEKVKAFMAHAGQFKKLAASDPSLAPAVNAIFASAQNGFADKIPFVGKKDAQPSGKAKPPADLAALLGSLLGIHPSANGGAKKDGGGKPVDLSGPEYQGDPDAWASQDYTSFPADGLKKAADQLTHADALGAFTTDPILANRVGTVSGGKESLTPSQKKLAKGHHDLATLEEVGDSVRMAAVCIGDLVKRFPHIKLPYIDVLYASKANNPSVGAEFTRNDEGETAVCFHADYANVSHAGDYCFGHKDARFPFDILRHELGHAIGKGAVHQEWKKFIGDTYGFPAEGFFKVMKDKVSKYAAVHKPGMKTPDIYEALAETFSKVTSHDYKPGTLPRPIEDFIYTKMLGCKPAKKGE